MNKTCYLQIRILIGKKSILILNMLPESVDLTLVTFSNEGDNNNVKKQLVL